MHVTRTDAPGAWRRFVALALDAFRGQDAPDLPEPPTTAQMTKAMLRLAAERGCAGAAARSVHQRDTADRPPSLTPDGAG